MNYESKYIKYKQKYINLKYQNGGNQCAMDFVGTFKIESGQIVVKDPGSEVELSGECFDMIIPVHNGRWYAYANMVDDVYGGAQRVAALMCINKKIHKNRPTWKYITSTSVDTGQAGFFDIEHFQRDSDVDDKYSKFLGSYEGTEEGAIWYDMCCGVTNNKAVGTIPYGVVSSAGSGDGSYGVFGMKTEDKYSKLIVVYYEEDTNPILDMSKKIA